MGEFRCGRNITHSNRSYFVHIRCLEPSCMKKISVVLADDHTVVRQGLKMLLNAQPDIEVVGEAENGWQAVELAKTKQPDLVLMDISMPDMNGIEASRQILRDVPATRVLILSTYSDDHYVQQVTSIGVSGYLTKQTASEDLVKAIREIYAGNAFFSPTIARRIRDRSRAALSRAAEPAPGGHDLTVREVQVLQLIAKGFSNRGMSAELGISIKTVEKHRQQLMRKLGIHHIAGLTLYAINNQMINIPEPIASGQVLAPATVLPITGPPLETLAGNRSTLEG
jgi:DNA-binding NarL/FixJ family response regulator